MASPDDVVKALIDGLEKPIDRPQAWTESLRTSGAVGRLIADDLVERFSGGMDLATVEGLQAAIERTVYTVQQAILGAACMAKHLHLETQKLEQVADRDVARAVAATAFRSALPRQFAAMQAVSALVGMDSESYEIRAARFVEALDLLPNWEEGNDAVTDNWPQLEEGLDGIPLTWMPFIHRKSSFMFRNLPVTARTLYLRCIQSLAGDDAADLIALLRQHADGHFGLVEAAEHLDQRLSSQPSGSDGGEDNLIRHFRRWSQLTSIAVAFVKALHNAMTSTSRQPHPQLAALRGACPMPWPKLTSDLNENAARCEVTTMVTGFIHEHIFTSGEGWVLTPPGVIQTAVLPVQNRVQDDGLEGRLSKSDGIKFLQGQLQNKSSTYRIPRADSTQRDWEAWFDRMASLQDLFPGLPARIIIPMVLGMVPSDDKRFFGWREKTMDLKHRQEEPTLEDFISHVRSQVMANAVTRREAYIELDRLTRDYRQIEDCQALSTKLQQLWSQLYPPSTTEIEPINKLDVLRMIHNLLHDIRSRRGARTVMMQAWFDFNYDHTTMFVSYVDSELHTSKEETDILSAAFLKEVCRQLQQAHRMSVQVGPNASAALDSIGGERPRTAQPRHSAAAMRAAPPIHRVATWVDYTGSKKRDRSQESGPFNRGRGPRGRSAGSSQSRGGRPQSPSSSRTPRRPPPPGYEGHSAGRSPRPPAPVELEKDYRVIFNRMRNMRCSGDPKDRLVGHLRGSFQGLTSLPYEQAVQAVLDGGCTLCQETGHIGKFCPVLKEADEQLRKRINNYNSLLREARRKQPE